MSDPGPVDYDALAREAEMGYDLESGDSVAKVLCTTTDAEVWAKHFKRQFGDVAPDFYTMLTWFANAIETGRAFGMLTLLAEKKLANELADVLTHMVVGWEERTGIDLAQHPSVQAVMAKYREARRG